MGDQFNVMLELLVLESSTGTFMNVGGVWAITPPLFWLLNTDQPLAF
jgi:hypothetical protein